MNRGQLFAKDEIKKLLKEIDKDALFWIKQRPKFESIFKEVSAIQEKLGWSKLPEYYVLFRFHIAGILCPLSFSNDIASFKYLTPRSHILPCFKVEGHLRQEQRPLGSILRPSLKAQARSHSPINH
jgi:hypothetical protein